ncbi:MAG: single-stranded DNA-binding protein [Sphaerochaetaceae bacterium]|jgi:single-strand DNA-binding protein|nr:single-stranded DNA-binding protein [Sphaerochaetaceae bacterium]MDC7236404.1 single-stranded DNA-binding protein [Sphaerochaetaceae bacterium]MDC7243958.1 single-stranded DNA-binding protein [Sphaerochaetaceae bacterium]MDC7250902.1 single-stranded DNA-binding protein [Sphaerochaetaceae bacterium]
MATDLNIVALVGRLTRPCEMRYTNSGFAICSFSLAVNRRKKSQDGSWNDSVSFFDCSYFGKAAEGVSQYLTKGQQVSIQGYLDQQSWETNGQKRSKVVVIVNSLSLLGSSGNSNNTNRQTYVNNGNTNQNYSGQAKPNYNGGQQFGNTGNNYSNNNSNNSTNANVQNNGFSAPDNFPSEVGPEDFADDIPF